MRKMCIALLASAALFGGTAVANPTVNDSGTSFTLLGQTVCVDRSGSECDVRLQSPEQQSVLARAMTRVAELVANLSAGVVQHEDRAATDVGTSPRLR
jgi:hypothetical protein